MKVELLDYLLADPSYSLDEAINIIDFYDGETEIEAKYLTYTKYEEV